MLAPVLPSMTSEPSLVPDFHMTKDGRDCYKSITLEVVDPASPRAKAT